MRIPFDDLIFDMDTHSYFYLGKPYTGMTFDLYPDGVLRCETTWESGLLHGLARRWYSNGQLKHEYELADDVLNGKFTEWYPAGQKRREGIGAHGRVIRESIWDESGLLVKQTGGNPKGKESR